HLSLSVAFRQAEHKVADDVALNLAGAGFDGVAARAQIAMRPFAMIDGVRACAAELPIRAEHLHSDLLHALVHLAPEDFLYRTFRAGHAGLAHARERTHLVQAEDFDFGVNLRQLLADHRVLARRPAVALNFFG